MAEWGRIERIGGQFFAEQRGVRQQLISDGQFLLPTVQGTGPIRLVRVERMSGGHFKLTFGHGESLDVRETSGRWLYEIPIPPPPTIARPANFTLDVGRGTTVSIYPAGTQPLSITLSTSSSAVVASVSSQSALYVTARSAGSATITITVTDSWGQSASTSFVVTARAVATWRYPADIRRRWTTYSDGGGSHSAGAIDIEFPYGTTLYSSCNGVVTYAGWENGGGGNVVVVRPNGESTGVTYAHMSRIDVGVGQSVSTSTILGAVGATGTATGPHLHLEVRRNGNQWGSWYPVISYYSARGVSFAY